MRYSPMLAKPTKEEDYGQAIMSLSNQGYVAERKYDGFRMMLELSPGELHLYSRTGKENIELAPWLGNLSCNTNELVVDGELYTPGGSATDAAKLENRDKLVYVVFDLLSWNHFNYVNVEFQRRRSDLVLLVNLCKLRFPDMRIHLSEIVADGLDLYQTVRDEGGEGIMMKDLHAPYAPGKRSWAWQKIKVTNTWDVVVTGCDAKPSEWRVRPGEVGTDGVLRPNGLHTDPWLAGHVGLTYGWYFDGELVTVGQLGYTGPKEELELLVGKVAEMKAYGVYRTGALRHPQVLRFREDKPVTECVFTPEIVSL